MIVQILFTALAVWASLLIPGIDLGEGSLLERGGTLLVVAVIFGLVNVVLKPIAKTLGCLLYVLTLGIFGLVVNGLLYWLTGWLAEQLGLPFAVDGFWPAFWGAIIVSLVTGLLGLALRSREAQPQHDVA
ncbi:MAG: phage holin family protein [Pseudonocardiaceae bacterium]|nr:phage holin family protein [Pseudonocardiaceae bacterium]